jgi:hypothetical protein
MTIENPRQAAENLTRPRLTSAVWVGLSVLWLFLGWRKIAHHDEFGWFLCAVWAFVALLWSRRLFLSWRKTKTNG